MKKIFSCLLLFAVIGTLSTGCGGNAMSNATPKEVLVAFFDKISKKDIDGAAKLATKESAFLIEMMKLGMKKAQEKGNDTEKMGKDMAEEFKNLEIGEGIINGDVATVPIRHTKENRQVEFPLKKENGAWKVDFTMEAMQSLMRQNMGINEDHGAANNTMNGMDSLSVQEGMKIADSLMKNIDPKKLEEAKEQARKALEKLKQPQ